MKTKNNAFSTLLAVLITAVIVGALSGVITYASVVSKKDLEIEDLKEQLSQAKEEATVDETADWKTYANDEYGFAVKYPQNWAIAKRGNYQVHFTASGESIDTSVPGAGNIYIRMTKDSSAIIPDNYDNKKSITVDGINAVRYDGVKVGQDASNPTENNTDIYILKNGKSIVITKVDAISDISDDGYSSIFDQILSTFQFTK